MRSCGVRKLSSDDTNIETAIRALLLKSFVRNQ